MKKMCHKILNIVSRNGKREENEVLFFTNLYKKTLIPRRYQRNKQKKFLATSYFCIHYRRRKSA